jgi:D-alanyl-D-alanine dipeptidase
LHSTGGAVDVTLVTEQNELIEMGTGFDSFTAEARTDFFEKKGNTKYNEVAKNRRILFFSMTEAGFTNFPHEWWHYDYGDLLWASFTEIPSVYYGVKWKFLEQGVCVRIGYFFS